jgi:hypothetical protein
VAVAAGVVGESGVAALVAFLEVTPEISGAAGDEVANDAGLLTAEPEGSRVVSKDLPDSDLALTTRVMSAVHLLLLALVPFRQLLERALGVVQVGFREVGVDLGGGEAAVPEQSLDDADVRAALQEVRGESVPVIPRAE